MIMRMGACVRVRFPFCVKTICGTFSTAPPLFFFFSRSSTATCFFLINSTPSTCLSFPKLSSPITFAPGLPHTHLSKFLEARIRQAIDDKAVANELLVRVVCVRNKAFAAKEGISKYFRQRKEHFPSSFPYKSKAVFVFQRSKGRDLCFFG